MSAHVHMVLLVAVVVGNSSLLGKTVMPPAVDAPTGGGSCQITGTVQLGGVGLADVIVELDGLPVTLTHGADGAFAVTVPRGWSGTIQFREANYSLTPSHVSFSDLQANPPAQVIRATRRLPPVPMFAVRRESDGILRRYVGSWPDEIFGSQPEYVAAYDDADLTAELRFLGNDKWQLTLTPKAAFTEVWFPYELDAYVIGDNGADDVFLTTRLFGICEQASEIEDGFHGPLYTGGAGAPVIVYCDPRYAKMLAAANWPARAVATLHAPGAGGAAGGRMGLLYQAIHYGSVPAVDETFVYGLIQSESSGAEELGLHAWHRPADLYKIWHRAVMEEAGLFPIPYPEWMRQAHGWMTYNLEAIPTSCFTYGYLDAYWEPWKHIFPWVQIYGQMSDCYPYGCCLEPPPYIHERYLPTLVDWVHDVVGEGGHVGYYARPREPFDPIDGRTPESVDNLQWLLDWFAHNQEYGANMQYIDVLCARYFGDGMIIAGYLGHEFPADCVIEYSSDLYPAAFAVASSLYGHGFFGGGPEYTNRMDAFDDSFISVTFPRFGRFLMDDQVIILGSGSGDETWWGPDNAYWTERQIFLHGAKIGARKGYIEEIPESGILNHAVDLITQLRDEHNWWSRWPRYRDRDGIYGVPAGIEVRRFVDNEGVDLFVVDNWDLQTGQSFMYRGTPIAIPGDQQLSIIEQP